LNFQVNKRIKGWVFSIERKINEHDWVAMQILRLPKTKVNETRARRLLDDMIIGYTKQGLTVRGSLGAECYVIYTAEELPAQRPEPMPPLFGTGESNPRAASAEGSNESADRAGSVEPESGAGEVAPQSLAVHDALDIV